MVADLALANELLKKGADKAMRKSAFQELLMMTKKRVSGN